mmetsp:Transcript_11300/g.17856  ORF Transcript_11300/g.17856 Transcript_11300/m.17856 type:complete len:90 (+) Transcript_11300:1704-1973(+)
MISDFWGGRCCERQNRDVREIQLETIQVEIIRPKVMTPLANAVSFINDESLQESTGVEALKEVPKRTAMGQLLWCQIDQLELSVSDAPE